MPVKQLQLQCAVCDAVMPHSQPTPNHVLHAVVTLFTVGIWLPIWLIIALTGSSDPAACVKCGNKRSPTGAATVMGQAGGVVVAKDVSNKTKLIVLAACVVVAVAGIGYGLYLDG